MKKLPLALALLALLAACNLPGSTQPDDLPGGVLPDAPAGTPDPWAPPPARAAGDVPPAPTPDAPHPLPDLRENPETYIVQPGDTLGIVANAYGIALDALIAANALADPNLLSVGQVLEIPPPQPAAPGPALKLIPDSELIYSAYNPSFDLNAFINQFGSSLAAYREEVDGETLTGAQVVARVARDYSVNPRLLLALLEHQSGWVTTASGPGETLAYPMGYNDPNRSGLYLQLAWAADRLNFGYYAWRVNALAGFTTADGLFIPSDPTLNAGTAGLHALFAGLYGETGWRQAVSEGGFLATYQRLFGWPFDWALEPVLPPSLQQPELQLPFEPGVAWLFTGGPHGGWDDGSGWAALDFAPPGEQFGCVRSDAWVVAMANGLVVIAENGAVLQDLDGDGNLGTGWVLFYMHIETRGRVDSGTFLRAGERIGHPSCEGGVSTGTHLHIARLYNGEWIPADGPLPFVLDGWVSVGSGILYDGILTKNGRVVEACECREDLNTIQR
ncbi:MAG: LysM peptidoglycan-binding domain-containing protein [Anaerolineae bacterium]|nr:MAG: LysM peptidoglycan-binding domain-containing protein [Anaerolineae bacterium]